MTVTIESQRATVQTIRNHHELLGRAMADHALNVRRTVDRLSPLDTAQARMAGFCGAEVLPHAAAEEETLYRAGLAIPEVNPLVRAMAREHELLSDLVADLRRARTPGEATAAAAALNALFQAHLEKENEYLLPALVDAGVDLAGMLAGMH